MNESTSRNRMHVARKAASSTPSTLVATTASVASKRRPNAASSSSSASAWSFAAPRNSSASRRSVSVLWDSNAWSWRPECSACRPSIKSARRAMAAAFSATWRFRGTWWWCWCGCCCVAAVADGAVDGASDAVSLIDSASSDVAASSRASCASRPAQRASSVALWRAAVWSAAISVSWCARRAMSWPKSCSRRGRFRMPWRGVGPAAAMVVHSVHSGGGVKRWAHTSGLAVYLGCATVARRFLGSVSCRDCRRPTAQLGF
mmetsp:Transcript_27324/g.82733  ORF Transcript_27324/g.82733 Transcript_27324/m.82733 type:complete len:260 (-) Transcript_27324:57-836(-)